jgi:4-diphosphocytidyl-2-C-methyl-D-erythritol kinase
MEFPLENQSLFSVRAFAKVNLGLHILGKRPDGYHSIETIFYKINCYDTISFRSLEIPSIQIFSSSSEVPQDSSNLCWKAAKLLQEKICYPKGVEIHLEKNIPVGAGLGGGSSDAAATLRGLNKLWNLGLRKEELLKMASELGSDVPFFILNENAYATGRGEILEPIDLNLQYWLLTVTPDIHISTNWAYKNIECIEKERINLKNILKGRIDTTLKLASILVNDFESIVFSTYPKVEQIHKDLLGGGAHMAQLSGSGSTVFGLFESESKALQEAHRQPANYKISLTEPGFKPDDFI